MNEELETSKEELQSLNEELATVNSQLRDKVEDLDNANRDLMTLITATNIATVFLDVELNIKRFTPPTEQLLNLLPTDVGRPFRDFAPRLTDDDLPKDAELVLQKLIPVEKEITANEHWYLRRILPYRARDDRIAGVVIIFIDITQRVTAEAAARHLAAVLRHSNDAVFLLDREGRIMAWNHGAERSYGYTETQALTMRLEEIVPEANRRSSAEITQRAFNGEEIEPFETERLVRGGGVLEVWVTMTALKDNTGKIVALAQTERDVTARRAAEAEIRALNADLESRVAERTAALVAGEHRIRAILDATVDAIVTIDRKGTVENFNAAAENMFGYSSLEVVGRNVSMLMGSPFQDRHDNYLERYARTGERRLIGRLRNLTARRKDGTEFPIQLSVSEITELGLFTGIIRDMTESRRLQAEIVRISALEQRRIGEELHDTAQQELAGLGLLAQNLTDSLSAPDAAATRELARRIASGIAQTNRHVRALAQGLVPVSVDAEGLMTALSDLARRTQNEHGISCSFICPEPVSIADDNVAMHLYRIVQEAVANALKHAEAGNISIRLQRSDGALRVDVRDDGIGIDTDKPSEGLGLRIMEHRCGLIGGTFSAQRRDAGGTTISCMVPFVNTGPGQ